MNQVVITPAHPSRALATMEDFFERFPLPEAYRLLHVMMRAAFAKYKYLDKADILNLLYLKEELEKMLPVAEAFTHKCKDYLFLNKLFRYRKARAWVSTLNELFHAAVYDGFFTVPPEDKDIYHHCRGLFKLVETCHIAYKHQTN